MSTKKIVPADIVIYVGPHLWSAIYVKGKLDKVGDHDVIEERLRTLLGIIEKHPDEFMRAGTAVADLKEIDA